MFEDFDSAAVFDRAEVNLGVALVGFLLELAEVVRGADLYDERIELYVSLHDNLGKHLLGDLIQVNAVQVVLELLVNPC